MKTLTKSILIVDESQAVHSFVGLCLSAYQVRLTHVFNGEQALAAIEEGHHFDLVILDWPAAVTGGELVIDAVVARSRASVISMTTKSSPGDISVMLKKGVREYLIKPFTSDTFIERVRSALKLELANAS